MEFTDNFTIELKEGKSEKGNTYTYIALSANGYEKRIFLNIAEQALFIKK